MKGKHFALPENRVTKFCGPLSWATLLFSLLIVVGMGPRAANATSVSGTFSGAITEVDNRSAGGIPSFVQVGSPFQLSVSFDTTNFSLPGSLCPDIGQVAGCRARWVGTATDVLSMIVTFGLNPPGSPDVGAFDRIFVFDNFNDGVNPAYDGLLFVALIDGGRWLLDLRGPTNILSSTALPTSLNQTFTFGRLEVCLDPNIADAFTACGASAERAVGSVVPEPGTLALLGLGFAGLAGVRRRKQ